MPQIGNDWDNILGGEFKKPYYASLREFLKTEYDNSTVYPDPPDIFAALRTTPYSGVKAVIIGQDPYHEPGQAHGMCFSVKPGVPAPPSLVNIFKELRNDLGCEIPGSGYLMPWAEQGVLLLNAVLTVRRGEANSHKGRGWETFTDKVIEELGRRPEPSAFLLWGKNAAEKAALLDGSRHLILKSVHPSPLSASRGFFGNNHFSKVNDFLISRLQAPIEWGI